MQKRLKIIFIAYRNDSGLEIWNQKFFNETIFDQTLSEAILDRVNLSNCQFEIFDLITNSFFIVPLKLVNLKISHFITLNAAIVRFKTMK